MSVSEQDVKQGRLNDQLGSQLESISARVEANMENGRNAWADWKASAGDRARQAIGSAEEYAREKPWQLVGAAALIGVVFGLLCGRRH